MIEELITGLLQIWDSSNIILSVAGGLIGGFFCAAIINKHSMFAFRWYVIHTTTMITALIALFWVGQLVFAILTKDPLWGRIVGRFLLTILFAVMVGIGVWIGLKLRTRKSRR